MSSLLENFWLKIVALIMGLLLWLHVATEKTYNHEVRLPLTEIVLEDSLTLVNTPPDSLSVMVSATGKQLLRQKWREYGLRVNATQYGTGRHTLSLSPVNTSLAATGNPVTVEGIVTPTSLTLDIDRVGEARIPVQPNLVIEADEGFAVARQSDPEPPDVSVRGAVSLVRALRSVSTVQREISGVRNNLNLTLPLVPPEGYGVSISPDSVRIEIEVVPVKTRVFENIPIVVYNVPAGGKVTIYPKVINVELTGPPEDIDLLNRNALVASVDYRHRDSLSQAPIKIDTPANFRVKKASADSVTFNPLSSMPTDTTK